MEEHIDTLKQLNRDLKKIFQKKMDGAVQAQASARQLSLRSGQTPSEDEEFQQSDTSYHITKLLNPFKLSDRKDPTFENWILNMKDKYERLDL